MATRAEILRNSAGNFLGGALPALVTLVTLPIVLSHLGAWQYGIFTLVMAIVGYFALMDINVTAGSVKFLAEFNAQGQEQESCEVVTLGVYLYSAIGLAGGIAIVVAAPWLARDVFVIDETHQAMAITALRIAGVAFFFSQLQSYLQSIPQGLGRYDISGRYEALFGTVVPVLTAVVAVSGGQLVEVVVFRTIASIVNVILLWLMLRRLLPAFNWQRPHPTLYKKVLGFSGFAYLKRVANVTADQADKLIIGALINMQSLTFYAIPATLIGRVFALINRLGAVMFPASSALAAQGDLGRLNRIYLVATRYTIFLNGAISILLMVTGHTVLQLWVGKSIADQSAGILALLAASLFLESLTNLPTQITDGLGHPKVTGAFAVSRGLLGAALSFILVSRMGILGAAIAHFILSVVMTTSFLIYAHRHTVPVPLMTVVRQSLVPSLLHLSWVGALGWVIQYYLLPGVLGGLVAGVVMAALLTLVIYRFILRPQERASIRQRLNMGVRS
ncbi:oligosaccharide flippase family protein [Thiobacillus sp.]|uniref:oligosaccharide flippase family protein n=1 Tax=Thiobacillus sp. TaxID=924 RepID=UPI001ACA39A6|nr:oligosaccharide flippase family protein [Thiobacillus sp.]MBN8778006.1 oligosaccharide flippase family protein [Thiobacillus sp.]